MSGIRTPLNTTPAIALGNHKWVKEILRTGPLHYNGQVFDVTPEYLDTVVQAYQDGAIKRVPFQLAGKSNEHDESPERRRGFIEGVFREGDKLKSIIDLEDEANHLVETDLSFPVSVLIKHDRTKGNTGQHWDACLTHVLGTYDPVLDLDDWEPYLAASNQDSDVIDFLALSAKEAVDEPPADTTTPEPEVAGAADTTDSPSSDEGATNPPEEEPAVPSLADLLSEASEDDLKALRSKLDELVPADAPGDATSEDGTTVPDVDDDDTEDDDATPSDEEIEAMLTTADDLEQDTPEQVAASHAADESGNAIALANMSSQLEEMRLANEVTSRKLAEAEWKTEKDAWIHANIPPHILGLCEPFLNGASKTLALSHGGDKEKVAGQLRKVLTEISKQAPNLGLSQGQIGTSQEADQAREEAEARAAKARQVTAHIK